MADDNMTGGINFNTYTNELETRWGNLNGWIDDRLADEATTKGQRALLEELKTRADKNGEGFNNADEI